VEQFADHTQHRRVAAHRTLEPHNHRWAGPISSSNDTSINHPTLKAFKCQMFRQEKIALAKGELSPTTTWL
jgi:hypothetical protein